MSAAAAVDSTGLGCSVSTVKRRLHELVAARLITRTGRLNRTSLTYIAVYHGESRATDGQAEQVVPVTSGAGSVPPADPAAEGQPTAAP